MATARPIIVNVNPGHPVNATIAILIAVYIVAVWWQGNLTAFASAFWDDITGRSNGRPAFWQWLIALAVLYALAHNDSTAPLFGPILAIAVVGLFIQLQLSNPQALTNLATQARQLLGGH